MNFYIDKQGNLTKFETYAMVSQQFDTALRNLSPVSLKESMSYIQDLKTGSHVLYLHPTYKGVLDTIGDTVFSYQSEMPLDSVADFIQGNDCYFIVCKIIHSVYRTTVKIATIENVDFDSSIRKFYIDEFILDNND